MIIAMYWKRKGPAAWGYRSQVSWKKVRTRYGPDILFAAVLLEGMNHTPRVFHHVILLVRILSCTHLTSLLLSAQAILDSGSIQNCKTLEHHCFEFMSFKQRL